MDRYEKYFTFTAVIYFLISSYFAITSSLLPDEGTHLLLAVFYRDLFTHLLKTGISFENAWSYGLEYLLHYPKLQIAYPPLYHFVLALFFNFALNEIIARVISIIFYVSSAVVIYFIGREIFSKKAACFAALAFLSYFFVFFSSFHVLQDMCVYFFVILSFCVFLKALKNDNQKMLFLAGFLAGLAALSKQMGGIILFVELVILFLYKRSLKYFFVLLFSFFLFVLPYVLLLWKIGGIEINKYQGFLYAFEQGEPVSYLDPMLWAWYIAKSFSIYPLIFVFLLTFALYIKKKEKFYKELLIFFAVFYLALSIILNKESRFSTFFLIPTFLVFGKVMENKVKIAVLVIFACSVLSLGISAEKVFYFPEKSLPKLFSKEGNIAYFGESGRNMPFSSVIMWESRKSEDGNLLKQQRYHFRGCNFVGLDAKERIISTLKEKGIRYIVVYPNSPVNISLIIDKLKLLKVYSTAQGELRIYEFLEYSKSDKFCNKICLTGWKVCKDGEMVYLLKT